MYVFIIVYHCFAQNTKNIKYLCNLNRINTLHTFFFSNYLETFKYLKKKSRKIETQFQKKIKGAKKYLCILN